MKLSDEQRADLEQRLRKAGGLEVVIRPDPSSDADIPMAELQWLCKAPRPELWWNKKYLAPMSLEEVEAVFAHEYRHALGWWKHQRRFSYDPDVLHPDGGARHDWGFWAIYPVALPAKWVFEFQSDAFAARFKGDAAVVKSMLRHTAAYAAGRDRDKPWAGRLHAWLRDPHPPMFLRQLALSILGAKGGP